MTQVRAGDFRHLVTLQRPDPDSTIDAVGERLTLWLDVAQVYAKIDPLSSAERINAAQTQTKITHNVTIYYGSEIAAIDATWRVKHGTRYLILSGDPINVEERDIIFTLVCSEGLSDE